jgi:hypothetical protein
MQFRSQTELLYCKFTSTSAEACPLQHRKRAHQCYVEATKIGCVLEFAAERMALERSGLLADCWRTNGEK